MYSANFSCCSSGDILCMFSTESWWSLSPFPISSITCSWQFLATSSGVFPLISTSHDSGPPRSLQIIFFIFLMLPRIHENEVEFGDFVLHVFEYNKIKKCLMNKRKLVYNTGSTTTVFSYSETETSSLTLVAESSPSTSESCHQLALICSAGMNGPETVMTSPGSSTGGIIDISMKSMT